MTRRSFLKSALVSIAAVAVLRASTGIAIVKEAVRIENQWDHWACMYGIVRKPGELDHQLQIRINQKLQGPNYGRSEAYNFS